MATTAASPTSAETTAAVQDGGLGLPTDAFVDILLRLPSSYRHWVTRLVCRYWRDIIDAKHHPYLYLFLLSSYLPLFFFLISSTDQAIGGGRGSRREGGGGAAPIQAAEAAASRRTEPWLPPVGAGLGALR
ncbi:unnamed protein product [Urochloa humidicola]